MADEKTTEDETDDTTRNPPDEAREGSGQDYIDRSAIDFDPDDGLLSGTAIDGTSDIPGPHEEGEDGGEGEGEGGEDADAQSTDDDRPKPG